MKTNQEHTHNTLLYFERDLGAINELAEALTLGQGVDAVIETALNRVIALMDVDVGSIYLLEKDGLTLKLKASQGYFSPDLALAIANTGKLNDAFNNAIIWDILAGPTQGYFFEQVSGPADIYQITVPPSLGSVLLTVNLQNVPSNVEPNLEIYGSNKLLKASDYTATAGQPVSLTFDANSEQSFYVRIKPRRPNQTSNQPYTLSASTILDPDEPNDDFAHATALDFATGSHQGYFFERASGDRDDYQFTLPSGLGPMSVTVKLLNVPLNVQPRLYIYNSNKYLIASDTSAAGGGQIMLTFTGKTGGSYYLAVVPASRTQTSTQPYLLQVSGTQ